MKHMVSKGDLCMQGSLQQSVIYVIRKSKSIELRKGSSGNIYK